jgi:hypothetical protein
MNVIELVTTLRWYGCYHVWFGLVGSKFGGQQVWLSLVGSKFGLVWWAAMLV